MNTHFNSNLSDIDTPNFISYDDFRNNSTRQLFHIESVIEKEKIEIINQTSLEALNQIQRDVRWLFIKGCL